ncbi:zinc carboxypeptidase-like [Diorhabda sublineata]|uniref:zinc carboxypeptidase-like n=1 Tax=Diorhabda sublineata TaxID=1163346 RepID=UPI0024E05123|nr:zinc carboxypeptidase-like [Diorhabda sublineata]
MVSLTLSKHYRFDKHKLFRMLPKTLDQLQLLKKMYTDIKYDFWSHPSQVDVNVVVLVAPEYQEDFMKLLNEHSIDFEIVVNNIQELIEEERESSLRNIELEFNWDNYQPLEKIYNWLENLPLQYPTVTLIEGGRSYEDRSILGVKVSFKKENEKRAVWIDSLIHAREWITGATSTFILNEILTSTNPAVRKTVENFDWYILPVLNPDGYVFTQKTHRLWRKNRRPHSEYTDERCIGVDLNRNWGYMWNNQTKEACRSEFPGKEEFSEIETSSLAQYLRGLEDNIKIAISLHSFSQFILFPYAYTTEHIDNYEETREIAEAAAKTIYEQPDHSVYIAGAVSESDIGLIRGTSSDWFKAVLGVPIVFAFELRPSENSKTGFLLPAEEIKPTAKEFMASLITILEKYNNITTNY